MNYKSVILIRYDGKNQEKDLVFGIGLEFSNKVWNIINTSENIFSEQNVIGVIQQQLSDTAIPHRQYRAPARRADIRYIHVRGAKIVIRAMSRPQRDTVILQRSLRRHVRAEGMLHIPVQSVITAI